MYNLCLVNFACRSILCKRVHYVSEVNAVTLMSLHLFLMHGPYVIDKFNIVLPECLLSIAKAKLRKTFLSINCWLRFKTG